jgi:hypothetical protein
MPTRLTPIYILAFILAILIDLILIYQWRRKRIGSSPDGYPVSANVWKRMGATFQQVLHLVNNSSIGRLIELIVLILWATWVSRSLLTTPASAVPYGGEFSNLTQTHYIWTLLPQCGLCFLWNGSINGGAPAFAELTGAVLHPLVFLPVLLWGVIQGSKITFTASLALAGIAQWGLARKLGLGWWARMWSACLVVVGGHLSGKMENAGVGLVLGQACAALALTFGVDLLFNRNRKTIAWLAIALTLTLLSGEGYIQVAVGLTLLPALALFCIGRSKECPPAWKDYLLALGLAALLSGIFLAPLLHFLPQIGKDLDTSLSNYPPLEYIPLNLVIRDLQFQRTQILGKDQYLATHMIYIGWAPVLLALLALRLAPARLHRVLWIFLTGILLVFLITSLDLPKALIGVLPLIGSLRHLTVASGLVVPFIVGLASISLDEILRRCSGALRVWLLAHSHPRTSALAGFPAALLMVPFAVLSISPCYVLSQEFMGVREIDYLSEHMQTLQTSSAQWIQPPYGFLDWTSQALERGMKIGYTWRPWRWKERNFPQSYIEAAFLPDANSAASPYKTIGSYGFLLHPAAEYAFVEEQGAQTTSACPANSRGGWIDVSCASNDPAILTVRENSWTGWFAWVDGKPANLIPGQWLRVQAPAGAHQYQFRYLPWDVALGALLMLVGIILSVSFLL